jgi:mono/diheme cytochrome c family protein
MSKPHPRAAALTLALILLAAPAFGQSGDVGMGMRLAQEWCAKCHAIGRYGDSPLYLAPPFRDLHLRYDVTDLAESLAEGIMVGHPSMPSFRFDPDQIENLVSYLRSLER